MAKNHIALLDMEFHAFHGVHDFEKKEGNHFRVDAFFYSDRILKAGQTDALQDTIDYGLAYEIISDVMNGQSRNLLETLLHEMGEKIIATLPGLSCLEIIIRKLHPPVKGNCAASEVKRVWEISL